MNKAMNKTSIYWHHNQVKELDTKYQLQDCRAFRFKKVNG